MAGFCFQLFIKKIINNTWYKYSSGNSLNRRKLKKITMNSNSSFPLAAVTNCHKLNGLNLLAFISSHFCRLEVRNLFQRAEIKVDASSLLWRLWVLNSILASRGCLHSLTHAPFLYLQTQQHSIFSSLWPLFHSFSPIPLLLVSIIVSPFISVIVLPPSFKILVITLISFR